MVQLPGGGVLGLRDDGYVRPRPLNPDPDPERLANLFLGPLESGKVGKRLPLERKKSLLKKLQEDGSR